MTKYLNICRRLIGSVFCQAWFFLIVFFAVLQPDYLVHLGVFVPVFNLINVGAFVLVFADLLLNMPKKPNWGLILIFLVQLTLVFSSVIGKANVTFTIKKLIMITNVTVIAAKNLKRDPVCFVHCLYWMLFGLIGIHVASILLFPGGLYTSYYQYVNMMVPYLKHWFLSSGNNFVLYVLPAFFLDRVRLYHKGKKIDLFSVALYAMGFYGMLNSMAATALAACTLLLVFAFVLEWKRLPMPNLWVYTCIGIAIFVLLVFCDIGGILGGLLGKGDITFGKRDVTWANAVKWLKESPLLGFGYEKEALLIEKLGGNKGATHCHNLYLDLLYRSGILGLGLFLSLLGICGNALRKQKKHPMSLLLSFTLFMYLGILFQMEAYFNLGMFYVLVTFGLCFNQWAPALEPKRTNKKMTVYVCETVYHVMLATLLLRGQDNIIVCTTHEQKNMENFRNLRTKAIPEAHFLLRFRDSRKENLGLEMLKDRLVLRRLQKKYGFRSFDLVNFAWSVNSIDRSSALYYKKCRRATFFEEGAMGSIGVPQSRKKLLIKKLLGIPVRYHGDEKLQAVYVQNPELYDDRFSDKIHAFSLRSLMEDSRVGQRVISLFMDEEKAAKMVDINGRSIVFTQPLSEDGYIAEERKVAIYKDICEWFGSDRTILKLHPRDTSDYSDARATVLCETFPGELFDVLGVQFDAAVGICTSAVNNVDAAHPVNLNPDFLKDTHFDAGEMADLFEKNGVQKSK